MAPPDPASPDPENTAVPEMVSDYRAQLDALRNQARDLARMRSEVLAAADRESQAIVTAARGDIRDTLVRARRELLVLAAQVQAVTEQDVRKELGAAHDPDAANGPEQLTAGAASEARQEVRHVLSEARPDLDSLAIEAKILRANLLALRTPEASGPQSTGDAQPPDIDLPGQPAAPVEVSTAGRFPSPEPPGMDDFALDPPAPTFGAEPHALPADDGAEDASATRTSEPAIRSFDVPPQSGTPTRGVLVGAVAALTMLAVAGTGWWVYSQRSTVPSTATTETGRSATPPAPAPATEAARAAAPAEAAAPEPPALVIEAHGESWIRAQVDGRPDAGRVFSAGETRTITGASRVSVRAGNAGVVYVRLNGGPLEPLGPAGRPLTRDFILVDTPDASPQPETPPSQEDDADSPASLEAAPTDLPAPRASNAPVAAPTPTPAPAPAAAAPPRPTAQTQTAAASTAQEDELATLSRRWLDAYLSGNSNTMMALSGGTPDIRDQRPPSERTGTGPGAASRVFEAPRLQRGADIGVFSVRMTERPSGTGTASERVALVSQVWMRRTGKWQLIDVRIVSESPDTAPTP